MSHPEGYPGDYVHTTSVKGSDKFVDNFVSSEEAITSRDIDEYVSQLIVSLKETKYLADLKDQTFQDYLINDLVQDNILKLFSSKVLEKRTVIKEMIEKTTRRILVVFLKEKYPDQDISSGDIPRFVQQDPEFASYVQTVVQEARRNTVKHNMSDDPEYRQGIERIQKLVVERLKQRLADEELPEIEKSLNLIEKSIVPSKPHIEIITDMRGVKHVLRTDRMADSTSDESWTSPEDEPAYNQALEKFLQMPQNEHLLPYQYYDKEHRRAKVEFQEGLGNLSSELYGEERSLSSVEILEVLRDNIKGSIALEEEGLGMMDISLPNLGFKKNKDDVVVGLLPDPEGIYMLNYPRTGRIVNGSESTDPDSGIQKKDYWPPEIKSHKPVQFTSREAVFQFGVCLDFIVAQLEYNLAQEIPDEDQAEQIILELATLTKQMTFFDKNEPNSEQDRPSLTAVAKQLSDITEEIKRALSEVEQEPMRLAA